MGFSFSQQFSKEMKGGRQTLLLRHQCCFWLIKSQTEQRRTRMRSAQMEKGTNEISTGIFFFS